jgi:predicted ATP-dependent serine protease
MADVNAGANRLIGRDQELATLGSFLGQAAVDGATLLLTGEPGVGKTALLVAAADEAAADGVAFAQGVAEGSTPSESGETPAVGAQR